MTWNLSIIKLEDTYITGSFLHMTNSMKIKKIICHVSTVRPQMTMTLLDFFTVVPVNSLANEKWIDVILAIEEFTKSADTAAPPS